MTERTQILKIYHDLDPINPRAEYDNVGTMICWHRSYDLGDKHDFENREEFFERLVRDIDKNKVFLSSLEDASCAVYKTTGDGEKAATYFNEQLKEFVARHYYVLELYLYDHSGITMRTSSFSCPWDVSDVGYIYVSRKNAAEQYGPDVDPYEALKAEVTEYDLYLTGQCWGYRLCDAGGEELDACWGFLGEDWRSANIPGHVGLSEVAEVHHMEPVHAINFEPDEIEVLTDED